MDSDRLRAWVLDALRRGWSPELIEGRLKAQCAGDPSMRISHECLYQWIYAKPQRALDLRQYLARGRKRRTRKKGRKAKGPRIPCFASMFVRQVRQCFSVVWADGFPRCRHRFPVM